MKTLALALLLLPGCGASALAQHARGASIAMLAVQTAADVDLAALDAREAACVDEACVLAADHDNEPVVAAIDAARTAVLLWSDAVRVADGAGDSPDLIAALVSAAARVVARWQAIAAVFVALGLELPALPAGVAGLVTP